MELTVIEIMTRGMGCGGCCELKFHCIIEGAPNSNNVKEVVKEDIIDTLKNRTFKEDEERLLPKVDKLVKQLIEDGELDLDKEADTTWKIMNSEWTRYYPKKKKKANSKKKRKSLLEKYKNVEDISPQEWAWVTIKAKKEGKNPIMAKAGIKAAFAKRS